MRRVINLVIFSALLAGAALVGPPTAAAATQDGNWSVLIITDKGDCDHGYRYGLTVASGHVRYRGDSAIGKPSGTKNEMTKRRPRAASGA